MENKELSVEMMFNHYCAWKTSVLSQRAYCREHGLRISQFNYWILKFEREELNRQADPQAPKPIQESGFAKLVVDRTCHDTPIFEINHNNGHRISFFELVDADYIKSLLC